MATEARPAACSPRKAARGQQQEPCKGIRGLGPIAPIPVNRKGNVAIAGHQGATAARLVGAKAAPAQHAESIGLGDETKPNQIHGAAEPGAVKATLGGDAGKGRPIELGNEGLTAVEGTATAARGIRGLASRHGNVPSAAACKGDAVLGGDRAKARKALGLRANAHVCDDSMHDGLLHCFGEGCGERPFEGNGA